MSHGLSIDRTHILDEILVSSGRENEYEGAITDDVLLVQLCGHAGDIILLIQEVELRFGIHLDAQRVARLSTDQSTVKDLRAELASVLSQ